jgi:integrase
VQRLLRAVDASSPRGLRGHALLLMMSTYGLGAGEAIRLQLQDIGWGAATLRVVRPKTGIASRCLSAGRGQGAGVLPARRPAAEHPTPVRVRAHEDAVY